SLRAHFIRSAEFYRVEKNERLAKPPRPWWANRLFILTTAIPTALATLYFGLVASDIYSSESRFVVRSADQPPGPALDSLFKGLSGGKAGNDAYSVIDFILSRDALAMLDRGSHVRDAVSSPKVDFVDRFPGFDRDHSFEAL